jgi:hypothetical protein
MDRFGQIGPEKGAYDEDVSNIANALQYGERAVTFALTHRMTRQQVTVVLKDKMEVYGADHGGGPPGTRGGCFAYVGVDEHGSYWFQIDLLVHWSFLKTKLGLHDVDAQTLSEFLAKLGGALGFDVQPGQSVITEVVRGVPDGGGV